MYEALDSLVQFTARGRCTEIFLQVFYVVEFLHHFVMFQFAVQSAPTVTEEGCQTKKGNQG